MDHIKILQLNSLSKSNIVVTGGSRDIGGGIVLELARAGAKVISVFRSKPDRAQKIVNEIKNAGGQTPVLVQTDLTKADGQKVLFSSWEENFNNEIDALVLCASGATIEINVDANMALVDKFLEIRREKLRKGQNLKIGTIIFLQSEPGHFHRVIDGVFDFLEYYRTKVGPAKRAGEDALRNRFILMNEARVRSIVVCPPEVTDTFNMKLFELQEKQARAKSRELSAMLGTESFVTIADVALEVRGILQDLSAQNGSIKLFGENIQDGQTELSAIYGEEAIYVHTYSKTGDNTGVGRIIVNPSLWKRESEPSFAGQVKKKNKNQIFTILKIAKEHMPGHFRQDIAWLFPGHKSIRTAAIALGRFFQEDMSVEPDKIILRKYNSVKFRGTVLPEQTLTTNVTLTEKTKKKITGDAIQTVDDKESTIIHGMVVERKSTEAGEALCLDQLVEAAAQTVGMHVLGSLQDENLLPLFHSTGEAEIFGPVRPGDNLLIHLEKAKIIKMGYMSIFSADALITKAIIKTSIDKGQPLPKVVREEKIASVKSLSGVLLPKEELLKKLSV